MTDTCVLLTMKYVWLCADVLELNWKSVSGINYKQLAAVVAVFCFDFPLHSSSSCLCGNDALNFSYSVVSGLGTRGFTAMVHQRDESVRVHVSGELPEMSWHSAAAPIFEPSNRTCFIQRAPSSWRSSNAAARRGRRPSWRSICLQGGR